MQSSREQQEEIRKPSSVINTMVEITTEEQKKGKKCKELRIVSETCETILNALTFKS